MVPCYNEVRTIESLLAALAAQEPAPDEVLVVDGGSTDGTVERIEAFRAAHPALPVRVLAAARPTIPQALNAGIRASSGEVLVRLDAHCRPHPGYLRRALEASAPHSVGVAGGGWDVHPASDGVMARAIALAVSHPVGSGGVAYRRPAPDAAPRDVDTVPFGCFRRDVWEAVGGFDERLAANEDYDYNYRVRRRGLRVVLDPGLRSDYVARADLRSLGRQYVRYGWWKAEMLRLHPQSVRWRHLVPPAFAATLATLVPLGAVWPGARAPLLAVGTLYVVALLVASLQLAARSGGVAVLPVLPLVFATLHLSWGGAVLANLLSFGRGPHVRGAPAPAHAD